MTRRAPDRRGNAKAHGQAQAKTRTLADALSRERRQGQATRSTTVAPPASSTAPRPSGASCAHEAALLTYQGRMWNIWKCQTCGKEFRRATPD